MKPALSLAGVTAIASTLAACTGTPTLPMTPASSTTTVAASTTTSASGASEPATASASATPSEPPTLGATLGPAPTSTSVPAASAAPMPTGAPTPNLLTTTPGATLTLGTANAFHADGWTATQAQPAGAPGALPAMSAVVNCDSTGAVVEYRFSNATGSIDVEAAQDIMSTSASNTVSVSLLADGKAVAEQKIGFKQKASLRAPLAGVTVLQIVAKPTGACTASSTALITKAVVVG